MSITALGKTMKPAIKVSPHSFRRAADTQTHAAGVDPYTWQRLRGETVHRTWSENLKRHGVVATFVVASNTIAEHSHPWSLRPPYC